MAELVREKYLSKIRPFYNDYGMIKVLTGVRRCGKSIILHQIMSELINSGVQKEDIAYLDLDSKDYFRISGPDQLAAAIDCKFGSGSGQKYLFIDEIQNVKGFEPLINAYRNDGVSVFITGSNSYLLSGDLITKLTGRYIEFRIHTFSFSEIRDYYQLNGIQFDSDKVFREYMVYGGYPKRFEYEPDEAKTYIRSVIDDTINKDILASKKVRDRSLLKRILDYTVSTPCAEVSSVSIANFLKNEKVNTLPSTVNRDLELIYSSKLLEKCNRYDIVGKKALKTLYKSYVADPAIHTVYPTYRSDIDIGHMLENIVYLELVSRGYDVSVGKLWNKEVDFVISRHDKVAFVQVTYLMDTDNTREREISPLMSIKGGYPKYLISMDPIHVDYEGIRMLHLVDDFLLGDGLEL